MKVTLIALAAGLSLALPSSLFADDEIGVVQKVAPNVYFHQGDLDKGHCNQGWIVFKDYVLVVDGNFPSGVEVVLPKIKATTDKPIKFVRQHGLV